MNNGNNWLTREIFAICCLASLFAWPLGCPRACANVQILRSFAQPADANGQNPYGLIDIGNGTLCGATSAINGGATLFKVNLDGSGYLTLYTFVDASRGAATLLHGIDGALYGTTIHGGDSGNGVIFKINVDGAGFTVLHNFDLYGGSDSHSDWTSSSLVQANDGTLYGTACNGFPSTNLVFKLNPDGSGFQVLHQIEPPEGPQITPPLLPTADGVLYGVTQNGGPSHLGTLFKLNGDGSGFAVLHYFEGGAGDGALPQTELILGSDGSLYGTTGQGGTNGLGTLFKISLDGTDYQMLYSLSSPTLDNVTVLNALLQGTDGALYGTIDAFQVPGAVFRFDPQNRTFEQLHGFSMGNGDANSPGGGGSLIQASDGALYGAAYHGGPYDLGAIFSLQPDGSHYRLVYTFGRDGSAPQAGLVQGKNGALFGTTATGGLGGQGTVFTIGPDGTGYQQLGSSGETSWGGAFNGANPQAALLLGLDGKLYGTTFSGGVNNAGVVFRFELDTSDYFPFYFFYGVPFDGANSQAELIQDLSGTLYGCTSVGGSSNAGTIFRLNSQGADYKVLHEFGKNATDGANPRAGLLRGADGLLYGTTFAGGSNNAGTVFRLKSDSSGYKVLHSFNDKTGDGAGPQAALAQGRDGGLYGSTIAGGANAAGTLFRLNPDGTSYKLLHLFCSNPDDGQSPQAALAVGPDGELYGTTTAGGSGSAGTCFRLAADGSIYEMLHAFGNVPGDAKSPRGALLLGSDGAFYGTSTEGGANGLGTVFRLTTEPKPPFVISILPLPGGGFHLCFQGIPGVTYSLEASTDLSNWVTLATVLNESGPIQFLDWNQPNSPQRFYRAVSTSP